VTFYNQGMRIIETIEKPVTYIKHNLKYDSLRQNNTSMAETKPITAITYQNIL
jgi:hypothetical protein